MEAGKTGERKIEEIRIFHHGRCVHGQFYRPEGKESFPVIIFSHGYNGHASDFRLHADFFAKNGMGAVCYTFCGGSTRDESGFATTDMTLFTEKEDLLAVLDEVKGWTCVQTENIFLFGSSQGGMISALAAEERPREVRGLLLKYPAFCIADDWNRHFPQEKDIPDKQELWGMVMGRRFFETIRDFDVFERIGSYTGPVLLMHGTEDAVVPLSYSQKMKEYYREAWLEVFPGEGHGFSREGDWRVEGMALYFLHTHLAAGQGEGDDCASCGISNEGKGDRK